MDLRRSDLAGELSAAVRTPPHQGPPRLPHPPTTRRPMAHLPPRRHPDPRPPPARIRPGRGTGRLRAVRGTAADGGLPYELRSKFGASPRQVARKALTA